VIVRRCDAEVQVTTVKADAATLSNITGLWTNKTDEHDKRKVIIEQFKRYKSS
jgi:hypothetical protein